MNFDRVERYAPLLDISVRSEGDGRTIDAYAAVFDTPQEIRDRDGHYSEVITRSAFDRTLAERKDQLVVLFNHGKTMYGTPSERYTMPYGVPLDVKAEPKGLWTSTRASKTDLGDEVLENISNGAIKGMSFSGAFVRSTKTPAATRADLPTITRSEVAMREFGATPFPAYVAAHIVGVRSEAAELFQTLSADDLAEFVASLTDPARSDLLAAITALAAAGTGNDASSATGHAVESTSTRSKALRLALLDLDSKEKTK